MVYISKRQDPIRMKMSAHWSSDWSSMNDEEITQGMLQLVPKHHYTAKE